MRIHVLHVNPVNPFRQSQFPVNELHVPPFKHIFNGPTRQPGVELAVPTLKYGSDKKKISISL